MSRFFRASFLACVLLAASALADEPKALREAIERGDFPKTNAVLIMRTGKLVYEGYFGDGGPELLNDTRSAMKSVTSLAVGLAIADGKIASVREPAFALLKDLSPFKHDSADKRSITIEDLLTMSSALDCNDDDDASPGNEDRMHEQRAWTRWAVDLPTMAGYRRDADGRGPWRYCTAGAFLLGQIVQRAVGMPIDRYIEQRVLAPLGITRWEWPRSPIGEVMTGGGLRLRARDAANLAWMVAEGGKWAGKRIVPAAWIDQSLTVRRAAYPGLGYGYLFWEHEYTSACGKAMGWYMAGNGGNAVLAFRELNAAVVIARTNYNARGMHQQTTAMLEKHLLPWLMCGR